MSETATAVPTRVATHAARKPWSGSHVFVLLGGHVNQVVGDWHSQLSAGNGLDVSVGYLFGRTLQLSFDSGYTRYHYQYNDQQWVSVTPLLFRFQVHYLHIGPVWPYFFWAAGLGFENQHEYADMRPYGMGVFTFDAKNTDFMAEFGLGWAVKVSDRARLYLQGEAQGLDDQFQPMVTFPISFGLIYSFN